MNSAPTWSSLVNSVRTLYGTEAFKVSAEWSWLLVAWLFPLGPLAFAAWWLVSAMRFELRRRAIISPSPGYVAAEGTTAKDRSLNVPVVAATFELEVKKLKRGHGYRLRSHAVTVRPFTIEAESGQRFDVYPDREAVALHAPLEGVHTARMSQVAAGDRAWIYGRASVIKAQESSATSKPAAAPGEPELKRRGSARAGSSLLVSTTPIAAVFRSERNRRLWLAATVTAFLVVAQLVVFGGYWDVVRAREALVGHVVDKSMRLERERSRFGRSFLTTGLVVTVEAAGRRAPFDVSQQSWDSVQIGSRITLLASPTTLMLGTEPYTTVGRCAVMFALLFVGLSGFFIAGLFQRPWYSVKRGWRGTDRPPNAKTLA